MRIPSPVLPDSRGNGNYRGNRSSEPKAWRVELDEGKQKRVNHRVSQEDSFGGRRSERTPVMQAIKPAKPIANVRRAPSAENGELILEISNSATLGESPSFWRSDIFPEIEKGQDFWR